MLFKYTVVANQENLYPITHHVREAVARSGVQTGIATIYCPHTTAGITINENADPDVVPDILLGMREAFPDRCQFRHMEGNSSSHLRASSMGASETVIIDDGQLVLGTWQGIYFCEFDPPRPNRNFYVKIIEG